MSEGGLLPRFRNRSRSGTLARDALEAHRGILCKMHLRARIRSKLGLGRKAFKDVTLFL